MVKPLEKSKSTSKTAMQKPNDVKAKENLNPVGKSMKNTFWATKHHDDRPDELVLIQLDENMMAAIGLNRKTKE